LYDARSGPNPNAEYHRSCATRKNPRRLPALAAYLISG